MHRNSIHDIKPSSRLKRTKGYEERRLEREPEEEDVKPVRRRKEPEERYYYEEKKRGGNGIWYVAVFCILLLIFALSVLFTSATVEVTPRVGKITLDELLTAGKDPIDSKALSFEMAVLEGEESMSVSSTEKEYVEREARGMVRIFNNHSSSDQNLLIDTRLETPDGLIYKTVKAVKVPGQKVVDGKTVPGSVDVEIYAESPGEEYNKEEADFKIFGFKGSPKYDTFYARTVAPIEGGMKGETYIIGDGEDDAQKDSLKESLKTKLLSEARAELPEDFVIYNNAVILDYDLAEIDSGDGDGEVMLKQSGTLYAFVFKKENLTRNLVKKLVSDYDNNRVYIPELETISVELMSASEINPNKVDTISLSVKDEATVIWEVDDNSVKESLAGIKKRKFESVMGEFKNIDKAWLSVKPFWKNSVPEKLDQIKIINTVEDK